MGRKEDQIRGSRYSNAGLRKVIDLRRILRMELARESDRRRNGGWKRIARGLSGKKGEKTMVIWWHLFLQGSKKGRKEAKGMDRKQERVEEEGKPVFVLSREREEGRGGEGERRNGENPHLCYLEKGGQNGSTLIPTTDLRNYYRLSG